VIDDMCVTVTLLVIDVYMYMAKIKLIKHFEASSISCYCILGFLKVVT
jgi:hypothetical protein